jgi:methionine synthase II (cobalamin-independent)
MAPLESLERLKQQWSRFKGNPNDETAMMAAGKIPGPHLPALFVMKMLLDRRVIEAGMWNDIQLEIRASEGSTLTIHGSDTDRVRVLSWIEDIASRPIAEEDLEWAREAANHHLADFLPDLQSMIWEWTPDDTIFDFNLIPAALIKDAARMYLQ